MKSGTKNRQRPNAWINRYNQWVIAGKIAVATNAMPEISQAVRDKTTTVYLTNDGTPHYSVIGQKYLHDLGIKITELT